jgi:biotin carboxyl carrier protein
MKTYKVKVNGKLYEVQLEEVVESNEKISAPAPASAPASAPAPVTSGSAVIEAPIAGKVLAVKVNVGDTVKKGQIVAVIEAMKLENEIFASVEGTVKEIRASVGAMVNNKDALIILG